MKKLFLSLLSLTIGFCVYSQDKKIIGPFSVSAIQQVYFSPGNLQFNAALGTHQCADGTTQKGTWRFAEYQWDTIGGANQNISETYNGWIDLFGWGTSGWNSGANAYQPWSTSMETTDYYPGGSKNNDLTGAYANADWGVYNQIGSDPAGTWRTLTANEWLYLFHERNDAEKLFGLGSVNGVNGTIILPDDWLTPSGVSFTPSTEKGLSWQNWYYSNSNDDNYSHNTYTIEQWVKLEQNGAVFLPAAGYRYGTNVDYVGSSYGYYWSSSQFSNFAYGVSFGLNSLSMQEGHSRHGGCFVRLARENAPNSQYYTLTLNTSDSQAGSVTGGGTYEAGKSITITATANEGYTFVSWSDGNTNATRTITIDKDITLTAQFEKETIEPYEGNGRFSVSATTKVSFAPGNLQFNAALGTHQCADGTTQKGTWRFAENQWDTIGGANQNISETNNGWIDLFGWGTSGWNSGANAYQPWSTSQTYSDYYPGGDYQNNLTGDYANADWGVYNQIGSDAPGTWRTLTENEWLYLFHERKDAEKLFGLGSVNGVNGTIILPDDWVTPSGVSFTPSTDKGLSWNGSYYYNSNYDNYSHNTYTTEQWVKLEQVGAVFLPAAGTRGGSNVNVGSYGYYWSSSQESTGGAYHVNFRSNDLDPQSYYGRFHGFSVRLARENAPNSQYYTLTLNTSNSQAGSVTGGGTYEAGTRATITAVANSGYTFVSWSDGNTNATRTITIDKDITLTAQFEKVITYYTLTLTTSDSQAGSVTGAGIYEAGTNVTITATANSGYTFVSWSDGNTNATRTITIDKDITLTAQFEKEAIEPYEGIGQFSVSATNKVSFSPGNLQYNAVLGTHQCVDGTTQKGTWRFAENQWDTIGDANKNISETYNGWIDLFGWGTSGWNSGAKAYQPWSTSKSPSDYYPGGDYQNNLTGAYANADWGVYNQIGSDPAGTWRTLTYDEWNYVCSGRANADNLKGQATVNGVTGFILLPDGWITPSGITFSPGASLNFTANQYSVSDWVKMEQNGAVFLPAAGYRYGTNVYDMGSDGYSWSSSCYDSYGAWSLSSSYVDEGNRSCGQSVRLARESAHNSQYYTLTLNTSDSQAGSVSGGGKYEAGKSVTITATANSGYTFVSWSDGNTNATRTITVDKDITLTAQFEPILTGMDCEHAILFEWGKEYEVSAFSSRWYKIPFVDILKDPEIGIKTHFVNDNASGTRVRHAIYGKDEKTGFCMESSSLDSTIVFEENYFKDDYRNHIIVGSFPMIMSPEILNLDTIFLMIYSENVVKFRAYPYAERTKIDNNFYCSGEVIDAFGKSFVIDDVMQRPDVSDAVLNHQILNGAYEYIYANDTKSIFIDIDSVYHFRGNMYDVPDFTAAINANPLKPVLLNGNIVDEPIQQYIQDLVDAWNASDDPENDYYVAPISAFEWAKTSDNSISLTLSNNCDDVVLDFVADAYNDNVLPAIDVTSCQVVPNDSVKHLIPGFEAWDIAWYDVQPYNNLNTDVFAPAALNLTVFPYVVGSQVLGITEANEHAATQIAAYNATSPAITVIGTAGWNATGDTLILATTCGDVYVYHAPEAQGDVVLPALDSIVCSGVTIEPDSLPLAIVDGIQLYTIQPYNVVELNTIDKAVFTLTAQVFVGMHLEGTPSVDYAAALTEANAALVAWNLDPANSPVDPLSVVFNVAPDFSSADLTVVDNCGTQLVVNYTPVVFDVVRNIEHQLGCAADSVADPVVQVAIAGSTATYDSLHAVVTDPYVAVSTATPTFSNVKAGERADGTWSTSEAAALAEIAAFVATWNADANNSPVSIVPAQFASITATEAALSLTDDCGNVLQVAIPVEFKALVRDTVLIYASAASSKYDTTNIALGDGASYDSIHVVITRPYESYQGNGRFSVSATTKVSFALGNLQFNAALDTHQCADGTTQKGTWRFAENQWDTIGVANKNISETYNGWIDLFGWGTSGWNSGAKAYQPWSTSKSPSDYYPGGDYQNNLTDAYANADWGVYNQIGADAPGTWRTLTKDEWVYLFHERKDAEKLFGLGSVNGVNGTIILPDDWITPIGVSFTPSTEKGLSWNGSYYNNSKQDNFSHNTYTTDQWVKMERNGAVFLPAAGSGYGSGTGVYNVGSCGYYWSGSQDGSSSACGMYLFSNCLYPQVSLSRYHGFSVRLARESAHNSQYYTLTLTSSDSQAGSVTGAGKYEAGTSVTITATANSGYTFVSWSDGDMNDIRTITIDKDITLTAQFVITSTEPSNPSNSIGQFSVSATTKVSFAPGNLQYNAALGTHQCADGTMQKGTWRFAEHQWDYVGDASNGTVYYNGVKCSNILIAEGYAGWIDLFGWGTSGWNSGANAYQPWSTSKTYSDYYPGGSYGNNLTDEYANADWGVYNQIGADAPDTWRTLTKDEWVYLFHERKDAEQLFGLGSVNGVNGTIILPDDWVAPNGVIFIPSTETGLLWNGTRYENDNDDNYSYNTYTNAEWAKMEQTGAVFLPTTYRRYGTNVYDMEGRFSHYWSSTQSGSGPSGGAFLLRVDSFKLDPQNNRNLYYGFGVRLVHDVETNKNNYTLTLNTSDSQAGSVTGAGTYEAGKSITITATANSGYKFVCWSDGDTNATRTITIDKDIMLTAQFEKETIEPYEGNWRFSVSATTKVSFAPGNLQYNAALGTHQCADGTTQKGTWRFAEYQWDYIGNDNSNISESYNGWIDLFGWGTSGWNSGVNAYQPWSTSTTNSDYYPGGDANNNLTGAYANADWGVYNQIGNDAPGTWRTLTYDEWNYVYSGRVNADNLKGQATVNGVTGFILLPDDWVAPSGITFSPGAYVNYTTNQYSLSDWVKMEQNGAVFLPAAGRRIWTYVYIAGSHGYYWSSSQFSTHFAYYVHFCSGSSSMGSNNRDSGFSVRLARESAQNPQYYTLTLNTSDSQAGSVTGGGTYEAGTRATITAVANSRYTFVSWSDGNTNATSTITIDKDITLTALFVITSTEPSNPSNSIGQFSVSADKKVSFSPGNLQFNAAQGTHQCADGTTKLGTWRFAEHQWDMVGMGYGQTNENCSDFIGGTVTDGDNRQISESYNGWIDLFGWGTSGWNSGANAYQPWSTSHTYSDYYPGGDANNNLTGAYANADWGVYNQIGNDAPGTWRTLTYDEWNYIYSGRANADNLKGQATVNGVTGFILLPDDWVAPSGITFSPGASLNYTTNQYSLSDWVKMELNGAVFLPAAGYHIGTPDVLDVGSAGIYWSSSQLSTYYACYVSFGSGHSGMNSQGRSYGFSVRLARESAQNPQYYTLILNTSYSQAGSVTGGGTYEAGTRATITAVANSGYTFVSWSDGNTNATRTITIDKDITLTAQFDVELIPCQTTYDTIEVTAEGSYVWYGETYTQSGQYQHTIQNVAGCDSVITLNLTITCKQLILDLRTNNAEQGTVEILQQPTCENAQTAVIQATASSNYHFNQWSDGNTDNPRTLVLTEDMVLYALFSANTYTITARSADNNAGYVTGSGSYPYGTVITLDAMPNPGYVFTQWSDGNADNPRTLTVTEDLTLQAEFSTKLYSIAANVNDESLGYTVGSGQYAAYTFATLTAVPYEKCKFVRWSDGVTTDTRRVLVLEDATYTAIFDVAKLCHIIVLVNDGTMGYAEGAGDYYEGETVTLTAIPYAGYRFEKWFGTNITDNPRTVVVTDDNIYMACFSPITGLENNELQGVSVSGNTIMIDGHDGKQMQIYTVTGQTLYSGVVQPTIRIDQSGVYLIRIGERIAKVTIGR